MTENIRIGVVGTGFIAGVIAGAIARASGATLAGVSSRDLKRARAFAEEHGAEKAFEGHEALVGSDRIDVVYVATPTAAKEPIALAAARAGKHLLVDKPFASLASLDTMLEAARAAGVGFMDATHFVHHPRTAAMRSRLESLGGAHTVRAAFYFPFADATNIRYDPEQEPSGAVGDLAWYTARAAVELMGPVALSASHASLRRAPNGAIMHGDGLLLFDRARNSTWSVGYDGGAIAMELQAIAPEGMLTCDDFVLDWAQSFAFKDVAPVGWTERTGMATRAERPFVPSEAIAPEVVMIEEMARIARGASSSHPYVEAARSTQLIVDAILEQG